MGAATAYHLLARDPSLSIAVIEKDPTYRYASTMLSDGNVRIQFNLEENIRISQYAMQVLETFADVMEVNGVRPDVSMRKQGNLFLVDEDGRQGAEDGLALQQALGCDVEWMTADQIADAYPPYAGKDIIGGTLGRLDGSVDPNAVVQGYRKKSIALGADFIAGEVASLKTGSDGIQGVVLASGETVPAGAVVNTAGAWAGDLLATAGIDLPVIPVMRNVHVVESPILSTGLPSAFLPSGLYIIPEHDGTWLMAWSQPDDPVGFDFTVHQHRFYDIVWPHLIDKLPAFDQLRVVGGWAGLYAVNTLDGNAILGEWPEMRGLYLANGFSGHGFQQCHAVGRYLAELILEHEPALDLSRLGPERILEGTPLFEHAGRII